MKKVVGKAVALFDNWAITKGKQYDVTMVNTNVRTIIDDEGDLRNFDVLVKCKNFDWSDIMEKSKKVLCVKHGDGFIEGSLYLVEQGLCDQDVLLVSNGKGVYHFYDDLKEQGIITDFEEQE